MIPPTHESSSSSNGLGGVTTPAAATSGSGGFPQEGPGTATSDPVSPPATDISTSVFGPNPSLPPPPPPLPSLPEDNAIYMDQPLGHNYSHQLLHPHPSPGTYPVSNSWSTNTSPPVPPPIFEALGITILLPSMPQMSSVGGVPLCPTNANLRKFLVEWSDLAMESKRGPKAPEDNQPSMIPTSQSVIHELGRNIDEVQYGDLQGDVCDYQGIDWSAMGLTRREARALRQRKYKNYCTDNSDRWLPSPTQVMPQNTENHFRFKKMKVKPVPYLPHFQLRHLLAAPSKSRVLYADVRGVVRQHNSATGKTDIALQFPSELRRVHISTIAAGEGLLVAGGLDGDYGITRIEPIHGGGVVYDRHHSQAFKKVHVGISNHIQVYRNRNGGGPVASLASNDSHVRVMDLTTQKIISDVEFSYPVNCTAVSPDGRLRVVVGDNKEAVVMAAEPERGLWNWQSPSHLKSACTPDILHTLGWHRDYGFACAWADDGYTLATGNQDRALNIWDIRKTSDISGARTPIATLRTIMAGVRSLHFSPAGSGKRVLVAAEEADVINIIDAQMYRKRQAFDVFGELGGVSFTDDGQDLFALCADPTRGGILHLERAGLISNAVDFDETADKNRPGYSNYDWPVPQSKPNFKQRNRDMQRLLRKAAMSDMELF